MDWMYGINLSRYLTIRAPGRTVYAVGRVLTPIVKAIADRDEAMAAALLPVTSKGDCVSQHLMFFLVTLLQRVKEPGSLGGCISHPGRDRRHLFRKRADFDTFCLDGLHPLVVNCYHGLIQWIIGDLNASPGKTGLIHMAFERKASCLVDGAYG